MLKNSLIVFSLVSLAACSGGGGAGGGSNSSGRLGSHKAQFVDAPTQGLQYYQDNESWEYRTTEANGVFYCNPGSKVTFSLRAGYNADLGSVTCGAGVVFPRDLDGVGTEIPKYLALLLHTLDSRFDGQDYSFSAGANGTIVIAQENINILAEANLDFNPSDVNSIMGTINELRGIRCLKQHVYWPLNSGDDRGALETQCKIDNNGWRTLANAELAQVIADMDTHLTTSELIFSNDEQYVQKEVATVTQVRTSIIADGTTDSAQINDVLISSMNRDFYGLPQGDFNLKYKTCKTFAPTGIKTLTKDGVVYVSSDNDPTLSLCVSLIGQALAEDYILSGSAFPNSGDVYSFDGNLNPVLTSGEVIGEGKFFIIDGNVEWFRSCSGASISVASQNGPCLAPENFNPID